MKNWFYAAADRIRLFDPLGQERPEIDWVKSVECYSSMAFAFSKSSALGQKLTGQDVIMKAQDGRFFKRNKWDETPVWHGVVDD